MNQPLLLRPLAEADLVERTRSYRRNASDAIGGRFFEAALSALELIGQMPHAGSPRAGELCDVPGLRAQRVSRFPCSWYYLVTTEHIDVIRLLADTQDLPVIFRQADPIDD